MTDIHDTADLVSKALRRAWQLGQTYWQQADSEYRSHWKKADATQNEFDRLEEDTRAAILTANSIAQPAPSFADAYQGAMEDVAIWKKRALEAEDLNRKFAAEINGPTHMGEPVAQPAPSVPDDILYRLGAAHDACLDGDHRECRDAITQLMCEIGPDGAVPEVKP